MKLWMTNDPEVKKKKKSSREYDLCLYSRIESVVFPYGIKFSPNIDQANVSRGSSKRWS